MTISPAAVIPGVWPDFRIYVLSPEGKYLLWALEGNKVSPEQLARLAEGGHQEIVVDIEDQFKYEQYLETNLGKILANEVSSVDQKAEIFSRVSTTVVKDAFETSLGLGAMSSFALQRTQQLIENALIFVTKANSLQALVKMIGHDYQTYEHATKVLWFTVAFLQSNPDILEQIHAGLEAVDEERRRELLRQCGVGALLHDIGKAFIPHEILEKKDTLTEVEWEIMKRHPLNSLAMLIDTDIPLFVKNAVLHHHENFHGGGYPLNLQAPNITTLARVLRIIDVFEAMTSRRPYKEPIAPMKAAQIMIGNPIDTRKGNDDEEIQDARDQGMKYCFDVEFLRKFIVFLGSVNLSQ